MQPTADNPFGISKFMYGLARLLFWIFGWKIEGTVHQPPRFVLICAPHTTNWDAFALLTAAHLFKLKLSWFVKKEAFVFPLGILVRHFGGIGVDRSKRLNMVSQAVEEFAKRDKFILAIPPEGTRHRVDYWKTGFYHIAVGAKVPLVLGYVDYARKVSGLGPAFVPTGDMEADFKVFREFYDKVTPKFPEQRGTVAVPPPRDEAASGDHSKRP